MWLYVLFSCCLKKAIIDERDHWVPRESNHFSRSCRRLSHKLKGGPHVLGCGCFQKREETVFFLDLNLDYLII